MVSVIFFGSFLHYSTKALEALYQSKNVNVMAVVTTPPAPLGRKKILTPTHTHTWAESHHLPIFTPEALDSKSLSILKSKIINHKSKSVDFFVVAGYGNFLPPEWLGHPFVAPLNLHPSLLPKYRGANPAEWALLNGEKETGVTLITMEQEIDAGPIIAQEILPIKPIDTRETLYEKLYKLAAKMVVEFFHSPLSTLNSAQAQPERSPTPYAQRLTRQDGFISWNLLQKVMEGKQTKPSELPPLLSEIATYSSLLPTSYPLRRIEASSLLIERATRALLGFPGVWSQIPTKNGTKRIKILSSVLENGRLVLENVQLEGQQPSLFNQIKNQIT